MEKGANEILATHVIIAALNEEEGIGVTINELKEHLDSASVLVVDGRSIDRTVEIAKNAGASIVFQDGIGKGDALSKGLYCSNLRHRKYVVITDADYTYPAEYLPEMIQILEKNPKVGMVCGNRFNGYADPQALHNIFYIGNRIIAFAHNLLNGVTLQDPLTGLRVVRASF
jgi:dolichol-phosphate hexosyltransferase